MVDCRGVLLHSAAGLAPVTRLLDRRRKLNRSYQFERACEEVERDVMKVNAVAARLLRHQHNHLTRTDTAKVVPVGLDKRLGVCPRL